MGAKTAMWRLCLPLAASLSLSACGDDDDNAPSGGTAPVVSIDEAYGNISVGIKGGTADVVVNADADVSLSVSCSASWLSVSKGLSPNKGELKYRVTCEPNGTDERRLAEVIFACEGFADTIVVSQPCVYMPSDAKTLVGKIFAGVNIGNTMEVPTGETGWGNPKVNAAYVAGLKKLGFNAVRIPCAWHSYAGPAPAYDIDADWLARVKEVVGYCVDNDMYVLLNSHWDTGWLEDNIFDAGLEEQIVAEQSAIWSQVAEAFVDTDEHLLFAGCNEPGMNETSSGGKKWDEAAVARVVRYEQAFVDAVRASGGNNSRRCLVVQGLGTDIAETYDRMGVLPDDPADRLIVEVHFYEPYQFALMEEDASWGKVFWYWGKENHKPGSAHNPTWGEESHVESQFAKMKRQFVDNLGVPLIVGEYSTRVQSAEKRSDKSEEFDDDLHRASRAYWNRVVTRTAKNNGCAPFYWETGGDVSRADGSAINQYAIDGIMEGAGEGVYPW